jgi:hypothetical protein
MKRVFITAIGFLLVTSLQAAPITPAQCRVLFEKMKTLAGEWKGQSTRGWEDTGSIRVIAAGTVIEFRTFDSHPGETMVTMVHLDGDRLLLTHYCVAKNQPRLIATEFHEESSSALFEYLDGTGLASRDTGHMDKMTLSIPDGDHYTTRWTWYSKGSERWMEEIHHQRAK